MARAAQNSDEAGSPLAIAADLRAIREGGGIRQAPDAAFANIAVWLQSIRDDAELRAATETVVETHVSRAVRAVLDGDASDACRLAAADSVRAVLLRPRERQDKVAAARRAAQRERGCALTSDGLRKREDVLLRTVAVAIHEDLKGRAERQGPQTIEEFVRFIHDDIEHAFESFDDGLRRLYRLSPMPDVIGKEKVVDDLLWGAAHMQYWAGRMVSVRMRGDATTETDLVFADAAALIMTGPFGYHEDKMTAYRLLSTVGRYDRAGFLQSLEQHDDGATIRQRFHEWLRSCHVECAYQRTYNISLLCEPHRFTYALWILVDVYKDLLTGDFQEFAESALTGT